MTALVSQKEGLAPSQKKLAIGVLSFVILFILCIATLQVQLPQTAGKGVLLVCSMVSGMVLALIFSFVAKKSLKHFPLAVMSCVGSAVLFLINFTVDYGSFPGANQLQGIVAIVCLMTTLAAALTRVSFFTKQTK